MKTSYEIFSSYKQITFEKFKNIFDNKIEKAVDKVFISNQIYNDLAVNNYKEIQNTLGEYSRVLLSIKTLLAEDSGKYFEEEFNNISKSFPTKEKKKIILLLAELDAMDDFFIYWNTLDLNILKTEENSSKEKIFWKGNNETEFIQLIYMLFHSKLLSNESGEITKLVRRLSEFFNLELGNNWESNLSNSIGRRNTDYKPQIIRKLNNAWEEYSTLMLEKKKKN